MYNEFAVSSNNRFGLNIIFKIGNPPVSTLIASPSMRGADGCNELHNSTDDLDESTVANNDERDSISPKSVGFWIEHILLNVRLDNIFIDLDVDTIIAPLSLDSRRSLITRLSSSLIPRTTLILSVLNVSEISLKAT